MTRRRAFYRNLLIGVALFVVACSVDARAIGDAMVEGGSLLRDATRSDAAAQAQTCSQWEIATWDGPSSCSAGLSASGGGCMVPVGWEPVFAGYGDWSGSIALRRCTAP